MTAAAPQVEVLPGPTRAPRRAWALVVVLVLVLVAVGLDDRRVHAATSARVETCAAATVAARAFADRRVSSVATYVRPAWASPQTTSTRAALARLVGRAARDSSGPLTAARTTCRRFEVRPWHGDLRARADACLATIDARLRWLDEVARDGGVAFRSAADPTAGCSA